MALDRNAVDRTRSARRGGEQLERGVARKFERDGGLGGTDGRPAAAA